MSAVLALHDVRVLTIEPEVDGVLETQFMMMVKGELVGRVGLLSKGLQVACIRQLFVKPEYRRQGLGRLLVLGCLQAAQEGGCMALNLAVRRDNAEVVPFYMRLGFFICHVFNDGEMMMVKRLEKTIG